MLSRPARALLAAAPLVRLERAEPDTDRTLGDDASIVSVARRDPES
jgi:hypothetical protein